MLLVPVFEIFYAFAVLFIACEMGQRQNIAYDECNEIFNQFKWYLFPVEIRRNLPIILNYTQQSVDIKCFGSAACDRETFKYVSVDLVFSMINQMKLTEFIRTISDNKKSILVFHCASQVL